MTLVELGEVASVRSSLVDPSEPRFGHLPHIAPDTIERATGRLLPFKLVKDSGLISGKYRFQPGDILYSKIRPNLNKATLVGFEGLCSADMYALQVDSTRLASSYLAYVLRSPIFVGYATNLSSRASIPKINRDQLVQFRFDLPSLDEQRRVAAILDHVDALRTTGSALLERLEALKQATFFDMFGDPTSTECNWSRVPLAQLVSGIASGESPNCETRPAEEGEWAVLKLSAVSYGTFDAAANKAYLGDLALIRKIEVRSGDLLFSRKNTRELVGAAAVARDVPPHRLLPDLIFRLDLIEDKIDADYLQALLMNPRKRPQIVALASGSAGSMPNISKARLMGLQIETPPIELQRRYSLKMRHLADMHHLHTRLRGYLEALFASLQSRALSGQL